MSDLSSHPQPLHNQTQTEVTRLRYAFKAFVGIAASIIISKQHLLMERGRIPVPAPSTTSYMP